MSHEEDREAVLHAVMNKYHHHSCKDWNEHIVDTTISALRARGVSRESADKLIMCRKMFDITRWQVQDALGMDRVKGWCHVPGAIRSLRSERDDANAEIARLRAALELISGDSTWHAFAREALNASKGTT